MKEEDFTVYFTDELIDVKFDQLDTNLDIMSYIDDRGLQKDRVVHTCRIIFKDYYKNLNYHSLLDRSNDVCEITQHFLKINQPKRK